MKAYQIAVIEGDGVGPEIIREGMKVLRAAADVGGIGLDFTLFPHGADHYLTTGEVLSDASLREMADHRAIFFGAAGDPRVPPGVLEVDLILKIRFELDQYVNLRPVKLYPNVESPIKNPGNIDFYVVRENTEDFYIGLGAFLRTNGDPRQEHDFDLHLKTGSFNARAKVAVTLGSAQDAGINMGIISRNGAERAMRYSFELARLKGKRKVTAVDKANVIPQMYGVWREAFAEVQREYPDIQGENAFADATNMWFVKQPESYGVVVMPNLFGDVISDLGAMIAGGLGFAAGANINPAGVSMFEPIHGSAPKYKNRNVINPIATILSGGLMLETLGEPELGSLVERAVAEVAREGKVRTKDMGGAAGTSEMGDAVTDMVKKLGAGL